MIRGRRNKAGPDKHLSSISLGKTTHWDGSSYLLLKIPASKTKTVSIEWEGELTIPYRDTVILSSPIVKIRVNEDNKLVYTFKDYEATSVKKVSGPFKLSISDEGLYINGVKEDFDIVQLDKEPNLPYLWTLHGDDKDSNFFIGNFSGFSFNDIKLIGLGPKELNMGNKNFRLIGTDFRVGQ